MCNVDLRTVLLLLHMKKWPLHLHQLVTPFKLKARIAQKD